MPNVFIPSAETPFQVGNTSRVDITYGDDGTAVMGDISKPYRTIQQAMNDTFKGSPVGTVIIGPGSYAEEIDIGTPDADCKYSIIGSGIDVTETTAILFRPPTNGAFSTTFSISNMNLTGGGAGPTFHVAGQDGDIEIYATLMRIDNNNIAMGAFFFDSPGSGAVAVSLHRVFVTDTLGHCMDIRKGAIGAVDSTFLSGTANVFSLEGLANAVLYGCSVVANGANQHAINHVGGAGTIRLNGCDVQVDAAGTGNMINTTGAQTAYVQDTRFIRAGGSGGINMPAGTVYVSDSATDVPGPITVTAATVNYKNWADDVGFGANAAHWAAAVPANLEDATDRMAAAVSGLLGGLIP